MSVIQYNALSALIKKGITGGFLLLGDEEYLKNYWKRQLTAAAVSDPSDMFNRWLLNAESYTPQALKDAIEALPSFADRKTVELSGISPVSMRESELDELCAVLSIIPEHPETTVIMHCTSDELPYVDTSKYVQASDRKAAGAQTKLASVLNVVVFPHETPAKLAQWIIRHFEADGAECPPESAKFLIQTAGRDMYRLSGEIDKLSAYLLSSGRKTVTPEDIRANVTELFEFGDFDFSNALLNRDCRKAFRILREMRAHPDASKLYPPEFILGSISRIWSELTAIRAMLDGGAAAPAVSAALKMNSYRAGIYISAASKTPLAELKAGLDACRQCDRLMKTSPLDSSVLLDRLVISLCS